MDYFRILNLTREPFSNSPDPELFYRTRQHLECLQQLEIAVRLKRGLNVVIGEVGTGKTTLCRQFLRQMADDPSTNAHLILDPDFSTAREFLEALQAHFSGKAHSGDTSEWKLKEWIKSHLFEQAVDRKKGVVLVIDEGQKIPPHCLEILRELLNYESNNFKLLQIVIFAQQEFSRIMESMPNFADRINFFFELGPMSFRDTVRMIRYRLEQSRDLEKPPVRFTPAAYVTVYRATRGYPRKVINLCHQLLLGLIVQNKSLITWPMVRSTVERMRPSKRPWLKWATAGLVLLLVAGGVAAYKWPLAESDSSAVSRSATGKKAAVLLSDKDAPPLQSRTATSEPEPAPEENPTFLASVQAPPATSTATQSAPKDLPVAEAAPSPFQPAATFGLITVEDRHTLWQLVRDVYGLENPSVIRRTIDSVVQANQALYDPNVLMPGMVLTFPRIPDLDTRLSPGIWLSLATASDLETALLRLEESRARLGPNFSDAPVRLVSQYADADGNREFSIVLAQPFKSPSEAAARQAALQDKAGLDSQMVEVE